MTRLCKKDTFDNLKGKKAYPILRFLNQQLS